MHTDEQPFALEVVQLIYAATWRNLTDYRFKLINNMPRLRAYIGCLQQINMYS